MTDMTAINASKSPRPSEPARLEPVFLLGGLIRAPSVSAGSSWTDRWSSDPLAYARGSDPAPDAGDVTRHFAVSRAAETVTDPRPPPEQARGLLRVIMETYTIMYLESRRRFRRNW